MSFWAMSTPRYGVNVAGGEMEVDGYDEILTAAGPGPPFAALVRGFDYDASSVRAIQKISFFAYGNGTHGARVSSADIESDGIGGFGDGYDELLTGRGPGRSNDSQMRLFDYDGSALASKWDVTRYGTMYGLAVSGGDVDRGDAEEVVAAPGPDPAAPARVQSWEWNPRIERNGGPQFEVIGTDDFTTFLGPPQLMYGAAAAAGAFE